MQKPLFRLLIAFLLCLASSLAVAQPKPVNDPLPSWNDSPTKSAIIAFVQRVTAPGSPGFVPVAERIATFDNDGTL